MKGSTAESHYITVESRYVLKSGSLFLIKTLGLDPGIYIKNEDTLFNQDTLGCRKYMYKGTTMVNSREARTFKCYFMQLSWDTNT